MKVKCSTRDAASEFYVYHVVIAAKARLSS